MDANETDAKEIEKDFSHIAHDKKRMFLVALVMNLGIVSYAAKQAGVHRRNHYLWMADDIEYAACVQDINEITLDFAESCIHKKMASGDTACIIFYLKTKGRRRGYIEQVNPNQGNEKIVIEFVEPKTIDITHTEVIETKNENEHGLQAIT